MASAPNTGSLRARVVAAKERLAEGNAKLRVEHDQGGGGCHVARAISDLRDAVVLGLFGTALEELGEADDDGLLSRIALVAHGGYGRRDVAPFSDVDLMLLHEPGVAERVAPLAQRLLRDVFDAGLVLGHSVRTIPQACKLAVGDPMICSSLIESRLLSGSELLFERFQGQFRRQVSQRRRLLIAAMEKARREERGRYGETVYLLEPNIKRSRGGLRDLHLLRWIGFARHGAADPAELHHRGVLTGDDVAALDAANEFLLRVRNDLHFHAGRASDVLSRAEQVRIAERRDYPSVAGLLPVEQFMRDYFRHSNNVSHIAQRLLHRAQTRETVAQVATALLGHRVEGDVRSGPMGLIAGRQALRALHGDLTEIMRLLNFSNLYDKPISPSTWDVVRREAARLSDELPLGACHRFVTLLKTPARLGRILRDMHEIGLLERFIPAYGHARGLLQFNQYHKFTVDEHCLRAVEFATALAQDTGPLGRVYQSIRDKHVVHLALLIHDLGKGRPEDHCEVGRDIATDAAERLGLTTSQRQSLEFLVLRHDMMNHMAFRRDTGDERLVVRFAVRVGSPELLKMLYVITAADLGAVGPGVFDGWKSEIITDLYHRAMQHLAGDSASTTVDNQFHRRRGRAADLLRGQRDDAWMQRQLDALPAGYLLTTEPEQIAADLIMLHDTPKGGATADARYLSESESLQFTVGTSEEVTAGIFHKLCGALTSQGLEILSAQIHTMADDHVLDRFWVRDPDYAGEPPAERIEQVKQLLVSVLQANTATSPRFRRTWQSSQPAAITVRHTSTRINVDNSTSDRYTILDIFARDRTGLLYAVTRKLFELGLPVHRAKISTHLDQVVDVFYVTDAEGQKVTDEPRLAEIRRRLLDVIDEKKE